MSERYLTPEQKISNVESIVYNYPEVAGLQAYEYLRSGANEQKTDFIAGKIQDLELEYPYLSLENIIKLKKPMLQGLVVLMPGEKSLKSESLYSAVEYRYSELFMMDMARIMTSKEFSKTERNEAQQWFNQVNEGLYGKPKPEVFNSLAAKNIVEKMSINPDDTSEAKNLKEELSRLVGNIEKSDFIPFIPDTELVARIGSLVHERFDSLVSHINPDEEYDVQKMASAINIALEKLGGSELGWRVDIAKKSSALAVSAHKKVIEVGESRPNIQGIDLKGKIIHELGVHAGRSISANKAGWLSAAYGQEGYLDFEESLATALEDAYKGEFGNHGVDYQLVAGFAYGYDNHEPRDFRDTYEVMWRINALGKIKDGEVSEKGLSSAKSKAFTSCLRLFRGTTGLQKGVIYLKDLAYFNGQESVWNVLKEVHTQSDFDKLFAGKLDNSKPSQDLIANYILSTR